MAKNEVDAVTEEKLARGGILAKLYFDMQDKDKDKLQPIMLDLVNERLLKEPGVVYCYGSIEEPLEKDGIFSTSAMLTVLFEGLPGLIRIAFMYAPAGIEILKPLKEIVIKPALLQSIVMDLSDISINYSRFILEKIMKEEDVEKIKRQLENRTAIGKKLHEQRDKEDDDKEKK